MSLNDVWEAASGNPFTPTISKERQFFVGFALLLTGADFFITCTFVPLLIIISSTFDWTLRTQYAPLQDDTPKPTAPWLTS